MAVEGVGAHVHVATGQFSPRLNRTLVSLISEIR